TVFSRPVADFSLPANGCGPTTINPTDLSTTNHPTLSYAWTVSPTIGVTTAGMNTASPTIDFPVSQNDSVVYDIFLTITDDNGCIDTLRQNYTVYPKPTAAYTVALRDSCGPFTVQFNNTSVPNQAGEDINDMTFAWDFGNGQTDTAQQPTAVFTNTGVHDSTYFVTLISTNAYGCSDTIVDSITVYPNPLAQLNLNGSVECAPYLIDSTVVSAVQYPFANDDYNWTVYDTDFNTIATFNGPNAVNHTIQNDADSVYIGLSVTNVHGCQEDTLLQLFYTIEDPVAVFTAIPDTGCSPLVVQIQDSSSVGVTYEWFINGVLQSTTAANPSFTFTNNSTTADSIITIQLVVTAGTGCTDTVAHDVTIYPQPFAEFTIAPTVCAAGSLVPTNTSTFKTPEQYLWTVNSTAVVISTPNDTQPIITFPDNQTGIDSIYDITLTVFSVNGCSDDTTISVTAHSRPVADFSLPMNGCGPTTINPVDLSTTNHAPLSYTWTVTPNTGVTTAGMNSAAPTIEFPVTTSDSVVYDIFLAISDANGCADTITQTYTVYPKPTADFTAGLRDSCGPFTVQFTNISVPNQTGEDINDMSFTWDFGNGQTDTAQQTSATFTNTGVVDSTYIVTLIATNAYGCSDTLVDSITVYPNPLAELSITDSVDCAPYTIDSSIVQAVQYPVANDNYTWIVTDLSGTSLYTTTGPAALNYTIIDDGDSVLISLITSNIHGCAEDTITQLFFTIEDPVAVFEAVPDSGCSPLTVQIQDSSTVGVSYEWFVNDVLQSTTASQPSFTFTNTSASGDSTLVIKLVVTAGTGCTDTTERTVVVFPQPFAEFSIAPTVCANGSLVPTNTSSFKPPEQYLWTVNSPAVVITNPNDAQPIFSFPDNQSLVDSIYDITLTIYSANGCSDDTTISVTVHSRPVADFTLPSANCGPTTINPTDISTTNHAPLSYTWTVAPTAGVITTGMNSASPTIDFPVTTADSVVYDIFLTITDANGCIDTNRQGYTVYPKPTADFTVERRDSCGPFTVQFNNISVPNQTGEDINDMTFNWDFGNGQTSTDQQPSATFTNTGTVDSTYTVVLIATNAYGCSDTLMDSITVHPNPLADFTWTSDLECAPFTVDSTFVTTTDYPVANSNYTWTVHHPINLTTLATFNGINALNYTIASPADSVLIRLVVSSPFGCSNDTLEHVFTTIPNPVPGFILSDTAGCHPLTVAITDTSSPGVTYEWFINGQLSSTLAQPNFTLTNTSTSADSTYTTKLIVTAGGTGCRDSTEQFVTVYGLPVASFSATEVCQDDSTYFTDASTGIVPLTSWFWDFGDGNSDTTQNPVHLYDTAGVYTVLLSVTDARGCMQHDTVDVIVRPNPVVDFSVAPDCGVDTVCIGDLITLSDLSTVYPLGAPINQWAWDINADGSVEYTAQNPTHTFNTPGMTAIELTVTTQYSCETILLDSIFVKEPPLAGFTMDTTAVCGPLNVNFTNTSIGLIDTFEWEVYSLDSLGNRVVIYTHTGFDPNPVPTFRPSFIGDTTFYIELTATNCCGVDIFTDSITLKPLPVAAMLPSVTQGCSPLHVTFQLDGLIKGDPDYLTLDFGDGTPTDTLYEYFLINFQGDTVWFWGQPVHTFTYFGQNPDTTYTVTLSAYNECGDSTVTVDITVFPNTVQAFFIASPQQGCSPLTVDFYDRSYQGTNITWCFEWDTITNTCGQFTATGDTVQHTYTGFGTYIAAQIIDDGCSFDTAFVPILVYPAPTADFSVPANTCEDDSVFFQNLSTVDTGSINTVIWDFGDGTTSTQLDPTHVFDTAGVYSVCLTVGTNYGCFDSICYTLTIYDKPQFDVTVENACLNEQPVQFSDSSTVSFGSIVSRTWDFGDGNTSAQPFPQHTYAQAGTYTVVLTLESSNGCLDSLVQQVQIFPLPEASFTTALTSGDSCGVPQTYQFSNTSTAGAGFYWDFDYVNNPGTWTSTQNNPVFTYNQTGVYEVALFVENSFGCFDTAFTTLYIRPVPEAGFEGDTLVGCSPLFVQFTDTSNYDFSGPGGIVDWIWDFGDGTTVSGIQNPAHLYEDDGLFSVTLIVITDGGCSDTLTYTDYVRVYPRPQANFNSARIRGSRFQFNNTSVYEDSSTVFVWDFGDGTRSIQRNPVHQYNVDLLAGDYQFEVCLYALNSYECPDTICQPLFIRGYQLSVPNAFAPDRPAIGEASIFLPKGHSMIYYDCKIYDKWGTLVFESDTDDLLDGIPTKSWNGRFMNEGEILPAGAYVWKINAQFEDGTIWPGQGNTWDDDIENVGTVNLIR
ncbi:MAG: PKD domain-containing protein, partial [Flavobacteriia bacterium]|nr:PKD domain-containing protein [Flavobacteriia bacterium]